MTPMQVPAQAILYLTHVRSTRVLEHIARLRRETADLMPVFVCADERRTRRDTCPTFTADFTVDPRDWHRLLPVRSANLLTGAPATDYYDLFYLPALLSERLAGFSHIWFIENDVDFSGDWADFFAPAMACTADLIATTIYPRPLQKRWTHWRRFRTPARLRPEAHVRAFLPVARFSRRLIEAYAEEAQDPDWSGHFEAVWPTLAADRGWEIADLGGDGPFRWSGPRFYWNTHRKYSLSPGNFVYRPAQRTYFHQDPAGFTEKGQLHHPVKGW